MTTKFPSCLRALLVLCIATIFSPLFMSPAHSQTVVVMVNGEPVTDFDIEQRSKLDFLTTHKQPVRQDVMNELIDEKLKIKEAKKFGVDPSGSDIDQSYGEMAGRMHITGDQLTKSLEAQGMRPDTLKARIRADMVWTALVRGRYKERLQVGETDVNKAIKDEGGDASQKADAFEYKMQPIVLIVPKGASPAIFESRQKEAETLRSRVQTCDEANSYFKSMPNAAIREAVVKTSADIPAVLRKVLDDTPIGHLTPPEVTKQGVEMVVLCDRKPTTVDTPQRRAARDQLYKKKYDATSNTYLEEIRKAAMIEYPQK